MRILTISGTSVIESENLKKKFLDVCSMESFSGDVMNILHSDRKIRNLGDAFKTLKTMENDYDWIYTDGYSGMLWCVLSRICGWNCPAFISPITNPFTKIEVLCTLLLRMYQHPLDYIWVGSKASQVLFQQFSLNAINRPLMEINRSIYRKLEVPRNQLLKELDLEEAIYLVYAGNLVQEQSILSLLNIFFKVQILHPTCRLLLIANQIDEEYVGELSPIFTHNHHIKVIYNPPDEVMSKYYNVANLFVSAATNPMETFPWQVHTAMACGTPSIVPAYNGFRDIVVDSAGILIPTICTKQGVYVDETEFVREIYYLLFNAERLDNMSRAAEEQARKYSEDEPISFLEDLLRKQVDTNLQCKHSKFTLEHLPEYLHFFKEFSGLPVKEVVECLFKWNMDIEFTQEEQDIYCQNAFEHF